MLRKVDEQKEKSKEYLKLLKKLIDIQQHNEFENTDEDKFADLRKDMKLDIEQMKNDIIARLWAIRIAAKAKQYKQCPTP